MERIAVIGRSASDVLGAFRSVVAGLVLAASVGVFAVVGVGSMSAAPPPPSLSPSPGVTLDPPATIPDPDSGQTPATIVPTPSTGQPAVADSFSFMATDAQGHPLRIDPCSGAIEVVYDGVGEPYPTAREDLAAMADMAAFALARPIRVVDVPVAGGVDITFRWVATAADLDESDDVLGEGGPIHDDHQIIGGDVVLVAQPTGGLAPGVGPGSYGAVMLHELMHALNIGHSDDPSDVMYPTLDRTRPTDFGPGDVAAFAELAGKCPT